MRKFIKLIFILYIGGISLFSTSLLAQAFKHPGILQSKEDLDFVKLKITANQEPWISAYNGTKSQINLNYIPLGLVSLNNQTDADSYMSDGLLAYKCALVWYHSGNVAYANKAKQILNAWTVYNDPDGDQNLNIHWGAINFMGAAEIINSLGGGWSTTEVAAFKVFTRRLTTHMNVPWYNNAQQTQIRSRMACAVFLEDRVMFDKCITDWRYYIDVYYYIREDGAKPPKYPYPKIHGTTWELCRDFNHANMGSRGTFDGATIAWNQGVDLYAEQKYRMTEFLETTFGFYMGTIPIPPTICGNSFGDHPGVLYCNEDGRIWPTCTNNTQMLKESAYNHFKNRLGYNLPNTLAYNNARRTNSYFWVQVLTEYVQPFNTNTCTATITSPVNSFCAGSSALLTASTGASYKWFNGTTQVGTGATYTALAAGSYKVEVTNFSGCKATSAAKVITVTPLPTATITAPVTSFCAGSSALLTASTGASYKWFNGTTQVGIGATYTALAAGSYKVEVTNSSGCKATSAAKVITVTPLPTATINAPVTSFCDGGSVLLIASEGVSYKWFNGTTVMETTTETHTATVVGSYKVEVTNSAGCKATSAAKIITVTTGSTWYADADGDGKGDATVKLIACTQPLGYAAVSGDTCPVDPLKFLAGNCGCNKTEASCLDCAGVVNGIAKKDVCSVCAGGATGVIPITDASLCGGGKVGIKGPLCVEIGKSYKYTITTENIPVSNISWWSSSGATTTKTIGNDKEMTVLIPSYLTGSTAMFAGVNYTKNPYYKSYSLLVKVGGCAASAALSLRVEASPLPFDQTTVLTLENQETINAIVLMDINGLEVYRAENISSDSFEIGKELTPGMYLAHVYSSQGISVKKLMKLN